LRGQLIGGILIIIPLDGEAGHTGLLSEDIAANALNDGLGWRLRSQLLGVVLVVDIVANTDELTTVIAAGQEDDSDTQDFGGGDALQVGRIGLEDEFVHTDGDGADQEGIEFLVIFGAIQDGLVRDRQMDAVSGWIYEVAEPT
jgi:hypothetical protein